MIRRGTEGMETEASEAIDAFRGIALNESLIIRCRVSSVLLIG